MWLTTAFKLVVQPQEVSAPIQLAPYNDTFDMNKSELRRQIRLNRYLTTKLQSA